MPEATSLAFGISADEEHERICRARDSGAGWELGARLARSRHGFDWQRVSVPGAPFADWIDYLHRGLGLGVSQACDLMDAASLPSRCSEELGVEAATWLARITALTAVDETAEQALALELPLRHGGLKPARAMSAAELREAWQLICEEGGSVDRPVGGTPAVSALDLHRAVSSSLGPWLAPGQLQAHHAGERLLISVRDVSREEASEVFGALSVALR